VCPDISEAPAPQGGASRQRNIIYIVPLYLAYKAGLAGHVPVKESEALHPRLPALNRAGTEQGGTGECLAYPAAGGTGYV
jgi:hypothetical protein